MEQLQTIFKFISFLCIKEVYSNILQDSENKCHDHNGEQSSTFEIIGKYFTFHNFKRYPSLFVYLPGYLPSYLFGYLPGYPHRYPSGYPLRPCKANPCK